MKTQQLEDILAAISINPSQLDQVEANDREWKFMVQVQNKGLLPQETVAVIGNCETLGNWQLDKCILMDRQANLNIWCTTVKLPVNQVIEYRYLICTFNGASKTINVRFWEDHLDPRRLNMKMRTNKESCDIFGEMNGIQNISRGWLTTETILQLKIYQNAFFWKENVNYDQLHIKVVPMRIFRHDGLRPVFLSFESEMKVIIETARMKIGKSQIEHQPSTGVIWKPGDIVLFHITIMDLLTTALRIEISGSEVSNVPKFIGYQYWLPVDIEKSFGEISLPIITDNSERELGTFQCSFLLIKPLQSRHLTMRPHSKFWKTKWTALDIGHRGLGVSFNEPEKILTENTIASMREASNCGADMIEMDVHVTKDCIPVVYHDFEMNPSHINPEKMEDYLEAKSLLIKDLTYNRINEMKIGISDNNYAKESQIFPTLKEIFQKIELDVAFDIEIKWPQEYIDGVWESSQTIDKNVFIDTILEVILQYGCGRCVVLSSFDADICTLIRFKQNMYPVLLLTHKPSIQYPLFKDPRLSCIEMAVCNAQAMELLGIIPQIEDLIANPSQVDFVKNQNQVLFCWTDHLISREMVNRLKRMGLDGIIYDRVDKITGNQSKKKKILFD